MVTCPWCGTSYSTFQSSCSRCGGPLHPPEGVDAAGDLPMEPPPVPRPISDSFALKLMTSDAWSIAGFVFLILGGVFTIVGGGLTLGIVTAIIGLSFIGLGLLFLAACAIVLSWRYQLCLKKVQVLKWGSATQGRITNVTENPAVRVNYQHPWSIEYQYSAFGQSYTGQVSTFNLPTSQLQPGKPATILFLENEPAQSALYPHP
jgi:hypothetical protein